MDDNSTTQKQEVPPIPTMNPAAIISIKVSGLTYKKVQSLFLIRLGKLPKDEVDKVLANIKNGVIAKTPEEAELQFFAGFIAACETAAKADKQLTYVPIESLI